MKFAIQQITDIVQYSDVIMSAMASQNTGVSIVCSAVCSGADRRKYQTAPSLAFVRGIHRWPVDSPHHKRPVTRKIFPFDDVIMQTKHYPSSVHWNADILENFLLASIVSTSWQIAALTTSFDIPTKITLLNRNFNTFRKLRIRQVVWLGLEQGSFTPVTTLAIIRLPHRQIGMNILCIRQKMQFNKSTTKLCIFYGMFRCRQLDLEFSTLPFERGIFSFRF